MARRASPPPPNAFPIATQRTKEATAAGRSATRGRTTPARGILGGRLRAAPLCVYVCLCVCLCVCVLRVWPAGKLKGVEGGLTVGSEHLTVQDGSEHWPRKMVTNIWPRKMVASIWPRKIVANTWPSTMVANIWPRKMIANNWPRKLVTNIWARKMVETTALRAAARRCGPLRGALLRCAPLRGPVLHAGCGATLERPREKL